MNSVTTSSYSRAAIPGRKASFTPRGRARCVSDGRAPIRTPVRPVVGGNRHARENFDVIHAHIDWLPLPLLSRNKTWPHRS
jgi:hypothetical protein